MILFLTILILRYTRVYVSTPNCYNIIFYVEVSIDKTFNFAVILDILYVNPDDCYIRLGRNFDNLRS